MIFAGMKHYNTIAITHTRAHTQYSIANRRHQSFVLATLPAICACSGDWTVSALSSEQVHYAAADAFVAVEVMDMPWHCIPTTPVTDAHPTSLHVWPDIESHVRHSANRPHID